MSGVSSVTITTRLAPLTCGVGAYSWLAHKYSAGADPPEEFVVMEGATESRAFLQWDRISEFGGDPEKLAQALGRGGSTNVLLHYAGRAYQRFGCPIWMPSVFRKWKARFPDGRLTIFFHELPGDLPVFSRHFVLGKISARIVRALAAVADVLVTNTEHHASMLRKFPRHAEVHVLPVGSNIEPAANMSGPRADTEFVIFGLPFGRLQTLRSFAPFITKWYHDGVLTKLHLIGPEDAKFSNDANSLLEEWSAAVVRHGKLAETEVSQLLGRVRFALTNINRETWSKSTAFMASAAHDCAVVIREPENDVPLCYAVAANEVGGIAMAEVAGKAISLQRWYEKNAAWKVTAPRLAALRQVRNTS